MMTRRSSATTRKIGSRGRPVCAGIPGRGRLERGAGRRSIDRHNGGPVPQSHLADRFPLQLSMLTAKGAAGPSLRGRPRPGRSLRPRVTPGEGRQMGYASEEIARGSLAGRARDSSINHSLSPNARAGSPAGEFRTFKNVAE